MGGRFSGSTPGTVLVFGLVVLCFGGHFLLNIGSNTNNVAPGVLLTSVGLFLTFFSAKRLWETQQENRKRR
jgi:ABC-type uncharacterized transport system permease subunit